MRVPALRFRIPRLSATTLLLSLILIELFIGGGSRLVDVGPLSIRMYLFVCGLIVAVLLVLTAHTLPMAAVVIVGLATFMLCFSSVWGYINGAEIGAILTDVKPLLFIYSMLFFAFAIRNSDDVQRVVFLLKRSALILALSYIVILALIHSHIIPFNRFYALASTREEFFFRGEYAFFYKGFIYMCIGALFYLSEEKVKWLAVAILATAIVLTFTRGFFAAIVMTYFCYHAFIRKSLSKLIIFVVIAVVAVVSLWGVYYQNKGDRKVSDSARVNQIQEVFDDTTPLSALVGHGFGNGVPSRPEHMEIVYLETFHKQGVLGLAMWTALFMLVWICFKRARANGTERLAIPFMLSVMFVYIESISNPFLNNPIGLGMVLLAIVCLRIMALQPSELETDNA